MANLTTKTFKVKVKVTSTGIATPDLINKVPNTEVSEESFDETRIALKAQEIAEFNKQELESVKLMGEGEYTIDHKIIV